MKMNIFYRKKENERHSIEKVYDTLLPYFNAFDVTKIELPYHSKGIYKRILNILYAAKHQTQLNHISGDINYINLLMRKRSTLLTIHDVYPLYRTKGIRCFLLKLLWFELPIKKSEKIIAISEFSKREIIQHFNTPREKIQVIYNCISPEFNPYFKSFNVEEPIIFLLGTKINKNLTQLIEAVVGLKVKLVILGKINAYQKIKLNELNISFENFQNVTDLQLVKLYQQSDLVSFVSNYEGFGLPIIEAQAIGRPVITSNVASMPEIAGEGAVLVNPNSIEEIRNGILEIINNPKLREKLIKKGFENVKRFEPQNIANQYIELYKEVINV